jgi:hypothetical protein
MKRLTFRVRNLTNRIYAGFSDPGCPDQIYHGPQSAGQWLAL